MAGTAVTKLVEQQMKGALFQLWKFSLDPASMAAAAQGIETVTIPGARAGDRVSATAEAPEASIITGGAKVTADDTVSVYLSNNITVTTAVDGGALVWILEIYKFGGLDGLAA